MKFVEEKLKKGMEGWMSGSMSLGGKVTKIDACLSNSVVYQMSLRLLHKANIEGMEKPIRDFIWASTRGKRRYHLVSWKLVCIPKSKGGLGIKNLRRFNISLMCKWWWKLEHDSGPWQDFMWKKYLARSCVFYAKHKLSESPLWADMLKVKDIYLSGRSMKVNDGKRTHFWGDTRCGLIPLKNNFPACLKFVITKISLCL
jgi:hypothetical protein